LPGICCTPSCERSGEVAGGAAQVKGPVILLLVKFTLFLNSPAMGPNPPSQQGLGFHYSSGGGAR
jgi:hypothetical protein